MRKTNEIPTCSGLRVGAPVRGPHGQESQRATVGSDGAGPLRFAGMGAPLKLSGFGRQAVAEH